MTDDKDKDLIIEMTDQVRDQIADNPEMAAFLREFTAAMHQAADAVKRGQYKTMDDAMEAITGNRPEKIDPDTGEVIKGASLSDDMGLTSDDD